MTYPSWFTLLIARLRGKDPIADYFAWLSTYGRVAEGRILDFVQGEEGTAIHYRYQIGNVEYEAVHPLTADQQRHGHRYSPGANITVRFDPKQPGMSIVL
jgi:hypothetical protein